MTFPFRDVVQYGYAYLDGVNVFRATEETAAEIVYDFNIPPEKARVFVYISVSADCLHFCLYSSADLGNCDWLQSSAFS